MNPGLLMNFFVKKKEHTTVKITISIKVGNPATVSIAKPPMTLPIEIKTSFSEFSVELSISLPDSIIAGSKLYTFETIHSYCSWNQLTIES